MSPTQNHLAQQPNSREKRIARAEKRTGIRSEIDDLVALINAGIAAWTKAGKQLVVMLERDPALYQKIRAAHPEISTDMLAVFERIGRKQIYAPLLANNSRAATLLLNMPYEVQERFASEEFEVVIEADDSGSDKVVKKRLDELTRQDISQVFGYQGIRDVSEQREFLVFRNGSRAGFASTTSGKSGSNNIPKPVQVGFYRVTVDANGKAKAEPCEDNGRSHYAKAIPVQGASGWSTVIQVFKNP